MEKYDYKVLTDEYDQEYLEDELNLYANEGWVLFCYTESAGSTGTIFYNAILQRIKSE